MKRNQFLGVCSIGFTLFVNVSSFSQTIDVVKPQGISTSTESEETSALAEANILDNFSICEKKVFEETEALAKLNGGNIIHIEKIRSHFDMEYLNVYALTSFNGKQYVDQYAKMVKRDQKSGECIVSTSANLTKTWEIAEFNQKFEQLADLGTIQLQSSLTFSHICKKSILKKLQEGGQEFASLAAVKQILIVETKKLGLYFSLEVMTVEGVDGAGGKSVKTFWTAILKDTNPYQQEYFWDDPCLVSQVL